MKGKEMQAIRENAGGLTQAELARALEVSPVTLNRWENDDPRYKLPIAELRLLEALDELSRNIGPENRQKLVDLLRASTVAGVIAKAASLQMLSPGTITRLVATPGLGWLGLVAGIGVAAQLPFPALGRQEAPSRKKDSLKPTKRPAPAPKLKMAPEPSLYTLSVDTL